LKASRSKTEADKARAADCVSLEESAAIICPVCGAATVQEKCKVICRSEICHGRVIMNCAEF